MKQKRLLRKCLCFAIATTITLLLSSPVLAAASFQATAKWPDALSPDTITYLQENKPGDNTVLVFSLLGEVPREDMQARLHARVQDGMLNGFASPGVLSRDILNLLKLGENVYAYNGQDLIALLQQNPDLLRLSSVSDALSALLVYRAVSITDFGQVRNTPPALADMLVSHQQKDGAFAAAAGQTGDCAITAMVALALLPYTEDPVVDTAVQRALFWLEQQKLPDGAFPKNGLPSCVATSAVTILLAVGNEALSAYPITLDEQETFSALTQFYNKNGGYAAYPQGLSRMDVTELAIMAQYAAVTGEFPFFPVNHDAWMHSAALENSASAASAEDAGPSGDAGQSTENGGFGAFMLRFLVVLGAVFALLPITLCIGRLGERLRLPGSFAYQEEKQRQTEARRTPVSPEQTESPKAVDATGSQPADWTEDQDGSDTSSTRKIPAVQSVETSSWETDLCDNISPMVLPDFTQLSEQDTNGAVGQGDLSDPDLCS